MWTMMYRYIKSYFLFHINEGGGIIYVITWKLMIYLRVIGTEVEGALKIVETVRQQH